MKFNLNQNLWGPSIINVDSEGEGGRLDSVQDFLIKLDIELSEISIFSLNNDLARLTKIMNNLVKDLKILSFKVKKYLFTIDALVV